MHLRIFSLPFFLLLLVSAPASADWFPVKMVPTRNFLLPGFVVTLPKDDDWYFQFGGQAKKDGSEDGAFKLTAVHGKSQGLFGGLFSPSTNTYLFTATGAVVPQFSNDPQSAIEALTKYLKERSEAEATRSTRNNQISSVFTQTMVEGAPCVRWDASFEDRGVPGHESEAYILSWHRLACVHPEHSGYLIFLDYSQRTAPDAPDPTAEQQGIAILQSLAFHRWGLKVTTIPIGQAPQIVAPGFGALWAAYGQDNGMVARIDAQTNQIVARIAVGHLPIGVVADSASVWVVNAKDGTVSRIDPKSNKVVATINVGAFPREIAAGTGSVWVANGGDGTVSRIDSKTSVVTTIANVGKSPSGIAFVDGLVVVTDWYGDTVARIDPATNAVRDTLPGAHMSNFVLADAKDFWVNDQSVPAVLRLGTPPLKLTHMIGDRPTGLALAAGKLWVANWGDASLSICNPQTPDIDCDVFPTGVAPLDVVSSGQTLWVSVVGSGTVLRIDLNK
ncbi:MAG: YncE family protein [Proteobacteria bacterium]|nr:YncE family protein [Pseudomonadota bacterium]